MRKEQITERGVLYNFNNYNALLKVQANERAFNDTVKKQKVLKAQKIGGISKGYGKRLRYTGFKQPY